jgi:hypothetical protein
MWPFPAEDNTINGRPVVPLTLSLSCLSTLGLGRRKTFTDRPRENPIRYLIPIPPRNHRAQVDASWL